MLFTAEFPCKPGWYGDMGAILIQLSLNGESWKDAFFHEKCMFPRSTTSKLLERTTFQTTIKNTFQLPATQSWSDNIKIRCMQVW